MRRGIAVAAVILASGCVSAAPSAATAEAPGSKAAVSAESLETKGIAFIEDDVDGAMAKAKAEGKALFVDVWAPWCHTCLSMKNYVLSDPSLRGLAERVVFASIDSDRESSARFLERHAVNVWPMFFVIDPAADRVVGAWPGSASLKEMRGFVEESVATIEASRAGTLSADDPIRIVAEARAAQAGGDPAKAAAMFERAVGRLPSDHPRRSEVLAGWVFALYSAKDWPACAKVAEAHVKEVRGAAIPADFAGTLLMCGEHLEGAEKGRTRGVAIEALRAFTANPPADASADDRADAWGLLAEALEDAGDEAGSRRAYEAKIAILEKAAAEAKAPEVAATFDYARAMTYLSLGKGGYAIALLEAREKEMPGSYEPPARLASVLSRLGRHADAKVAVERAIAKSYGPRRLGYMRLRTKILAAMGDRAGAAASLREEVKGWEALAPGQASPAALADAKKRLAEAETGGAKP